MESYGNKLSGTTNVARYLTYINNKTTTIVAQSDISVVGLIGEREVVT